MPQKPSSKEGYSASQDDSQIISNNTQWCLSPKYIVLTNYINLLEGGWHNWKKL